MLLNIDYFVIKQILAQTTEILIKNNIFLVEIVEYQWSLIFIQLFGKK